MLAWQVLADGARRELPLQNIQRRCAVGFDRRRVGEKAGSRTLWLSSS
jgi:hypothetical protein